MATQCEALDCHIKGAVLSDWEIIQAQKEGQILIEPFSLDQVSNSSYDVTLGAWFHRMQKSSSAASSENKVYPVFNPYSPTSVRKVWGPVQEAQVLDPKETLEGIPKGCKVIWIEPGESILGHTQERIGGVTNITTMLKARSSLGRCCIEVCKCAGWGDTGYRNFWTMELHNSSQYYRFPLVVGEPIAQIVFFRTGPVLRPYAGSYQEQTSEEEKSREYPLMIPQLKIKKNK